MLIIQNTSITFNIDNLKTFCLNWGHFSIYLLDCSYQFHIVMVMMYLLKRHMIIYKMQAYTESDLVNTRQEKPVLHCTGVTSATTSLTVSFSHASSSPTHPLRRHVFAAHYCRKCKKWRCIVAVQGAFVDKLYLQVYRPCTLQSSPYIKV